MAVGWDNSHQDLAFALKIIRLAIYVRKRTVYGVIRTKSTLKKFPDNPRKPHKSIPQRISHYVKENKAGIGQSVLAFCRYESSQEKIRFLLHAFSLPHGASKPNNWKGNPTMEHSNAGIIKNKPGLLNPAAEPGLPARSGCVAAARPLPLDLPERNLERESCRAISKLTDAVSKTGNCQIKS